MNLFSALFISSDKLAERRSLSRCFSYLSETKFLVIHLNIKFDIGYKTRNLDYHEGERSHVQLKFRILYIFQFKLYSYICFNLSPSGLPSYCWRSSTLPILGLVVRAATQHKQTLSYSITHFVCFPCLVIP